MIRIYYGDDRVRAMRLINEWLGENHEVVEGVELTPEDLPSLFLGVTLFASERAILVRDALENRALTLEKYVNTPHKVACLESKVDKRGAAYKALKDAVEWVECKLPEQVNFGQVWGIYQVAKRDGVRAVAELRKIQASEDPVAFVGLMAAQALKDLAAHPGVAEKRALKELAKVDSQMKSSQVEPWLLVEAFLMRLVAQKL